jgi:hypothetical protein|tara:strand:- start:2279 stop:2419 length:141 start_codon:yes stop_codon:yes gene_type:complete
MFDLISAQNTRLAWLRWEAEEDAWWALDELYIVDVYAIDPDDLPFE